MTDSKQAGLWPPEPTRVAAPRRAPPAPPPPAPHMYSPSNPWRPQTPADWALLQQRARAWTLPIQQGYAYPWYSDPQVSLTLADYQHWRAAQGLPPHELPAKAPLTLGDGDVRH